MITRPNISSIVASQVPDFVREDYPTFIAFLEAYYDFLETQTRVDLKSVRDLDTTLDSFIQYFKSEIAFNVPHTVVSERFLMEHIKDLYLAKGSEASYKLLFRLLFNKNVELAYPGRQMLRASDGKWIQENSIFCEVSYGDVYSIVGKTVDIIVSPSQTIQVLVERVSRVEVRVDGIPEYSDTIYELHIDRRFFGKFNVGNKIELQNFRAIVIPTTVKVSIRQAGKGFKVGQLYDINSTGYGSKFKVKSIDADGGITNIELIKFGVGYNTEITSSFNPTAPDIEYNPSYTISSNPITGGTGYQSSTNDTVDSIYEYGTVNYVTYNLDSEVGGPALDGTYAGETRASFAYYNAGSIEDQSNSAIIQISIGPLAKYPGYYKNNDGFLDDAMFIQDSKYYQAFSYVVKIDERIEDFKSAVKTIIHPTGMALFADYQIENVYDIGLSVESILKILSFILRDSVVSSESISQKVFDKTLNYTSLNYNGVLDNNAVVITESLASTLTKLLNDITSNYDGVVDDNTATATDADDLLFGKTLNAVSLNYDGDLDNNTVATTDSEDLEFGKTLNETSKLNNGTTVDNNTVYAIHADALEEISVGKLLEDESVVLDSTESDINKPLTETQDLTDASELEFNKTLNGTTVLNDGTTVDDNTVTAADADELLFGKTLNETSKLNNGTTVDNNTTTVTDVDNLEFGKLLNGTSVLNDGTTVDDNTSVILDAIDSTDIDKPLTETQSLTDTDVLQFGKLLNGTSVLNDGTTVDNNTSVILDSTESDITKSLQYNLINPDIVTAIPNTSDQGTGSYGNYVLYLGGRTSTQRFGSYGRYYGSIIRGATSTESEILGIENYLTSKLSNTSSSFSPSTLFANGEKGCWYDVSDMTTLYQDSVGTVPITAVEQKVGLMLDKSGRGNNLISNPVYPSLYPIVASRINLLTATSTLSSQSGIVTYNTEYTLSFSGTGSIRLSGSSSGTFYAGTHRFQCTAGTLNVTVYGQVLNADLRESNSNSDNIPQYQNVISGTNYDTVGFPLYLIFPYFSSRMYSNSIDFSSTDKLTVSIALRKNADVASGPLLELSADSTVNNGTFMVSASHSTTQYYGFRSKGTVSSVAVATDISFKAPQSVVLTGIGDISNDNSTLRVSPLYPTIDTNEAIPYNITAYEFGKTLNGTTVLNDGTTTDDNTSIISDSSTLETTKYINNSNILPSESGYIELNPYAEDLSWSEDIYVGSRSNLF